MKASPGSKHLHRDPNPPTHKSEPHTGSHRSLKRLLVWIKDNLLKERPELFVQGDIVRPGILVLVNDSDWELLGQLTYEVKDGDNVLFISTLHGG
uniref:Ubiquitin-related modifier 1 homolog n=1 Tax=Timema californicum TaxID=61474 RepID=A0A7R9P8M9_TIMCA|nr:unnamed protein product [Timema californicum]